MMPREPFLFPAPVFHKALPRIDPNLLDSFRTYLNFRVSNYRPDRLTVKLKDGRFITALGLAYPHRGECRITFYQ
jgi:hypothetical protein